MRGTESGLRPRRRRRGLIAAGAAATVVFVVLAGATWRDLAPVPARLPPGSGTAAPQLLARDGTPLTVNHEERFNRTTQLSLAAIPALVRKAFIVSEDRRFWTHGGSDWRARFAALWQNFVAGHIVRGASTIGEQVARIITPRPRTYWSHWLDGLEASRLLDRFGHARVLDFYMNQVPYGAQRRGVEQAAHYYFGADVGSLDPAEQLSLIVLVRSPTALDPRLHPHALRRAIDALALRMRESGAIGATKLSAVQRSPIVAGAMPGLPVVAGPFVGYARARARALGLKSTVLRTTLDADLERFVQKDLRLRLDALRARRGVHDAAALVVDNRRGTVLAWAVAPARSATDIDPVLVPRQPGSTLKPFLYALAMEHLGWQPDTVLRDGPLSAPMNHGVHNYRNYSNRYYGKVSLRYALGNSLNIPAVETAQTVGVVPFLVLLHRLGVTTLNRPANYYGPAVAIGDGPIPLFDLVQAYSALARHGRYLPLRVLREVPRPTPVQVLRPGATSIIASILSDPNARAAEFGNNSVLDLPFPTAVKTGTSSDFRDALTVGFDNRYTVGVWMGRLAGGDMDEVTGGVGPALVLRSIFAHLRANRPYAGLWQDPDLRRVHTCEHIGDGPCVVREDWHLRTDAPAHAQTTVPSTLAITQPVPGEVLALDPRIADRDQIYTFRIAATNRAVRAVDWYLDGHSLGQTRTGAKQWPLARGTHRLSAQVWLARRKRATRVGPVEFDVE